MPQDNKNITSGFRNPTVGYSSRRPVSPEELETRIYTVEELQELLAGRDAFICARGLWSDFENSMFAPPETPVKRWHDPMAALPFKG